VALGRKGLPVGWKRRRARELDLAVIEAETAQLQVEALRAELAALHQQAAHRDIEMLRAVSQLTAASDGLTRALEQAGHERARLTRSIERLAVFALAPPVLVPTAPTVAPADRGAGEVIGGRVDPVPTLSSRLSEIVDLTADHGADHPDELPVAPNTPAEPPLECEVHLQFGDRWIEGFQIEETIRSGTLTQFRIRRQVDGWVLPELFDECEVRVFTRPVVET